MSTETEEALRKAREEAEAARQEADDLRRQYQEQMIAMQELRKSPLPDHNQSHRELIALREDYERKLGDAEARIQAAQQVFDESTKPAVSLPPAVKGAPQSAPQQLAGDQLSIGALPGQQVRHGWASMLERIWSTHRVWIIILG